MSKAVTAGLIVPVEVKSAHVSEFEPFAISASQFIKSEPNTVHWLALKQDNSSIYAFMNTFTTPAARDAHLATASKQDGGLLSKGAWYQQSPKPMQVEIVACKGAVPISGDKAGVTVGLHATLKAKADKIDEVKAFLKTLVPLVEAEPSTIHWFAIHHPGTNQFEIIDCFPDDAGRTAHRTGEVAKVVAANGAPLLESPAQIDLLTVLAGNVNA